MKILLTVHQFFPKYRSGTEVLTLETAKELINKGHDVRVVTAEPADYNTAKEGRYYTEEYEGITVYRINHHLGIYSNPVLYEYNNKDIANIFSEIVNDFIPDMIHIFHCSRLGAAIIDVAKHFNIPIAITVTDFWFLCPLSQMRLPDNSPCKGPGINSTNCLKCYVSKTQPEETINKINSISQISLILINEFIKLFPFVEKWNKPKMARALVKRKKYMIDQMNKLDKIIAPTQIMNDLLVRNGVKKEKIVKLSFGLNNSYIKKECEVKKYNGIVKFGFIGTLYEHKGAHVLIEAFKKLEKDYDNVELKIYGDLSQFPDYITYLKKLSGNDDKIKYLGTFPNSQIGEIFEDIDVLVVPSIWYENTPLVIYSAFSTKTPVIATNLGGMTEVVHDKINGLVFEKGNVEELNCKMKMILQDKALLQKLSSEIGEVKSIKQNVDEIELIYKNLIH